MYWFRDQQGLEVDYVVPTGHRKLVLIEAKASHTVTPAMADPLDRLARAVSRYDVTRFVVYRPLTTAHQLAALRPGTQTGGINGLLKVLAS